MWESVSLQSFSMLAGYCFAGLGRIACLLTALHGCKESLRQGDWSKMLVFGILLIEEISYHVNSSHSLYS